MIGIEGTFPLNGGRGRATLQCVWSIHRIDGQLGRYLDINSAWRNPVEQEKFYDNYRRYVNGTGPWAPIALPPEQSVHCKGEAIDTDDNNAAMTRILNDNGWFHTVFRNGKLVEPWHYEYDYKRDKYFGGQPAGNGSEEFEMPLDNNDKQWLNGLGEEIIRRVQASDGAIRKDLNTVHGAIGVARDKVITDLGATVGAVPDKTWLEPVPAQKPDGTPLTANGAPVRYTAEGFLASTNAQVGALVKALENVTARLTAIEGKLPKA